MRSARDERPRIPRAETQRAITELQLRKLLRKLARDVERTPPERSRVRCVVMRLPWLGPVMARVEVVARGRVLFTADEWAYIENAAAELGPELHNQVIGAVLAQTGFYRVDSDGTLWACRPTKERA